MSDAPYLQDVRQQYESLPYPPRDPADERRRLLPLFSASLLVINHHCFRGTRDFRNGFRCLIAGGGTGDSTIYLAEQLVGNILKHEFFLARQPGRGARLDDDDIALCAYRPLKAKATELSASMVPSPGRMVTSVCVFRPIAGLPGLDDPAVSTAVCPPQPRANRAR